MTKPVTERSGPDLLRRKATLESLSSANIGALLQEGRWWGTGQETRDRAAQWSDPTAVAYVRINDELNEIREELAARQRYHGTTKRIKRRFA